jgi:phenylacetate-coenzyme A ligase PaaK-like adenylate-forming protein
MESSVQHSQNMRCYYERLGSKIHEIARLSDVAPLPVAMFKQFDLRTCDESAVVRVLRSSGTTTSIPSKIYLDKATAFRQTRGLVSILKSYIGKDRKPLLVIDSEEVNMPGADAISARGAAIRGISNFAKRSCYILDGKDTLNLNEERLDAFCNESKGSDILVYGFTYIIWTRFVEEMERRGKRLDFPNAKVLHSGGWKKLKESKVEKKEFNRKVGAVIGTAPENVIDFYGMVEQVGVIFPDCERGHKHVPDFAEVIVRNPLTLEEDREGGPGLIEVMSILPSSYPAEAILTEDLGRIVGIDDCPCGRKGKYFEFLSRVEKAELRGCGDTFAERSRGK